jgi:hypothetical protein
MQFQGVIRSKIDVAPVGAVDELPGSTPAAEGRRLLFLTRRWDARVAPFQPLQSVWADGDSSNDIGRRRRNWWAFTRIQEQVIRA